MEINTPYTMVTDRISGNPRLDSIIMRVAEGISPGAAEHAAKRLLTLRRGDGDLNVQNSDGVLKTLEATSATMTLLTSTVAMIALLVGGIGIMNIMLVSVSERTSEIGVRMAIGARRADIQQQFLIEAVLVCLIGGVLGIVLAFAAGWLLEHFSDAYRMAYSTSSIVAAFTASVAVGVAFGYLPARNAARLDPVVALARE